MTYKPFLIEVRQDRKQPNGNFIPASSLKLTEEFRTTGLLSFLRPEDLKSLMYLLTFVSPEGHCSVTLPILTSAMKLPSFKVKQRMHQLAQVSWQGEPLIIEVPHASGILAYSLHPRLVAYEHLTVSKPYPTAALQSATGKAVVAHSRATYARPRAEVERDIAAQLGHDMTETEEQGKLRRRLENVGLTTEQAREIVLTHAPEVIAQQLDWLPFRNAKNPAGYLLAAIEGRYDEPKTIRLHRMVQEHQRRSQPDNSPESHSEEHQSHNELPENDSSESGEPAIASLRPDDDPINLTPES